MRVSASSMGQMPTVECGFQLPSQKLSGVLLNNSRSKRVLWLLEELEIPYDIKRYERDPKTMLAPASLRQIHPLGKSPVITDGELTLAESGAIIEYLVERYGNGRLAPAPGTPDHLRYIYWLHYAEGSAMPPLVLNLIFKQIERSVSSLLMKSILIFWKHCLNVQCFAFSIWQKIAIDSDRTAEGEVIPGIDGMIYERLGFNGQPSKNEYVPKIVKDRRARFRSSIAS